MIQRRSPWQLAAACVLMALAAAGCFQDVGDNPQASQVSQFIPTNTLVDTPIPPPTEMPTLVAQVVETETETSTPTPTETPTSTPTETPTATGAVDQVISDNSGLVTTLVAQTEGDDQDQFILTATQYVLEITQTAEFSMTQTAIALGIGATPTLYIPPTLTPEPGFITVTPTGGIVQPVNPGGVCIHEVKQGETLFHLSTLYGVSVVNLASASGITNPQLILVGQKINIPGCGTTGVYPPPTSMPTTAFDVSAQTNFGTGGSTLGQTVQIQTADGQIVEGQLVNGGQGGGGVTIVTTHVVEQYETLFQISQQYGVSVNSIAAVNGITNINMIIMGDVLNIPSQ